MEAGRNVPSRHSWKVLYLPVLFAEAEIASYSGEFQQALENTNQLIDQLRQYGMRPKIAEALYLKGMALLGLNQGEEARQCLLESHMISEEMGLRPILWRTLHALSSLESDPAKSEALLQDACDVIDFIASHIDQEDLMQVYLSQPEITSILAYRDKKHDS